MSVEFEELTKARDNPAEENVGKYSCTSGFTTCCFVRSFFSMRLVGHTN